MQRVIDAIVPKEVLYVEDHPTNVSLMKAIFRRRPHLELVVANDGREARELATHLQPSLLLLDLRLPDTHGVTLLKELRRVEGWANIPAVAVTAESGFQLAGSGFSEVWAKPLDLAFLLGRLDHLTSAPVIHSASREDAVAHPLSPSLSALQTATR
jgi:CheY-like chemotaxis protein